MSPAEFNAICNAVQAVGTAATPLVVAYIGARLVHRQAVHEASLTEKAKHYGTICPLINKIHAYRIRRGDFLNQSPEAILDAKRTADHEFWAFFYIWPPDFRTRYLAFMKHSFDDFRGEGRRALINVESSKHPIKPQSTTTDADGTRWPGFSDKAADVKSSQSMYIELMNSISKDMGLGYGAF